MRWKTRPTRHRKIVFKQTYDTFRRRAVVCIYVLSFQAKKKKCVSDSIYDICTNSFWTPPPLASKLSRFFSTYVKLHGSIWWEKLKFYLKPSSKKVIWQHFLNLVQIIVKLFLHKLWKILWNCFCRTKKHAYIVRPDVEE